MTATSSYNSYYKQTYAPSSGEISISQICEILAAHKFLILSLIAIATILATIWTIMVTRRYTADVTVILDEKQQNALDLNRGPPRGAEDSGVATEIERIGSRNLAQTAVEKLHLESDPEFNKTLRTPSWLEGTFGRSYQELLRVIQPGALAVPSTVGGRDRTRDTVIDAFMQNLSVQQVAKSRAIQIYFTSENPNKAAATVNKLGEEYVLANMRARADTANRAHVWLTEQLQDLRKKVQKSETAVENYRKQQGLFQGERVPLITEQISDMSKRLLESESARRAAEANLAQARRLLRSPDKREAAEQVFQSDLIQKLRGEEATLASREAALAQQYGPQHPALAQIREERIKFASEIDREINRIIARLHNELEVTIRQETSMTSGMNALKKQLQEADEASVDLRSLEREAAADRSLLEKALTSYMETSAQTMSAQLPDVSIVSPAAIPERPSFPRRGFVIAVAATLSGMVGVVLAFAIEGIDNSFRSAEQVERETGLTVLAHVPLVKTSKAGCLSSLALEPNSTFREAIYTLFTHLIMLRINMPPRTVLVTSAQPAEGKSTIVMSLAKLLAGTGRRILLIDFDVFRSTPGTASTVPPSAGLGQVLEGTVDIRDVIYKVDNANGLEVISAGNLSTYDILLDTDRLSGLVLLLKSDYDIILLDSAPLLVSVLTQRLATLVDSTILVVRWGQTRRKIVSYVVKQLMDYAANIDGVVLSMVNTGATGLYSSERYAYSDKAKAA